MSALDWAQLGSGFLSGVFGGMGEASAEKEREARRRAYAENWAKQFLQKGNEGLSPTTINRQRKVATVGMAPKMNQMAQYLSKRYGLNSGVAGSELAGYGTQQAASIEEDLINQMIQYKSEMDRAAAMLLGSA